jgi:hypothetical protein
VVPDKQQKVEIYIMNGMIVLRLLSDPMLREATFLQKLVETNPNSPL